MASQVQIYNLAAELIGTDARVTSPSDDRPLARNLSAVWEISRRSALRDGEWNFAIFRGPLAALAGDAPYPYAYAYKLPAGCLRLLEVLTPEARAAYKVEGGKILCDTAAPLYVRCLVDKAEPAEWDDQFAEVMAARLAWAAGTRISGSAYDKAAGWQFYQTLLSRAKSADAREDPPEEQEESDWVLARFGRSGIG